MECDLCNATVVDGDGHMKIPVGQGCYDRFCVNCQLDHDKDEVALMEAAEERRQEEYGMQWE